MTSKKGSSIVFNEKEGQEEKSTRFTGLDSLKLLRKEIYSNPEYAKPTPEELETLKQQIIDGDSEARIKLYKHHLRYVMRIARNRAKGSPELVKDLFSDGSIGGYEASQKWDPMCDGPFLPYVRKSILRVMRAGLRKSSRIKNLSFKPKQERERENEKGEDKSSSQSKSKKGKRKSDTTQTIVMLEGIDLDQISDLSSNPEQDVGLACYLLDWCLEVYAIAIMLIPSIKEAAEDIKNLHHRRFFLKYINFYYPHVGWELITGLLWRDKILAYERKRRNLIWYIPLLKEELGEEVDQWPERKILKKFDNTLDYILRRYIAKKLSSDIFFLFTFKMFLDLWKTRYFIRREFEKQTEEFLQTKKTSLKQFLLKLDQLKKQIKEGISNIAGMRENLIEALRSTWSQEFHDWIKRTMEKV